MRKIIMPALLLSVIAVYAQDVSTQERKAIMKVSGMNCGMCPISVRHRTMQLPGVRGAIVDMDNGTATVTYKDSEQSPQAIAQAITELGYPATVMKTGQ